MNHQGNIIKVEIYFIHNNIPRNLLNLLKRISIYIQFYQKQFAIDCRILGEIVLPQKSMKIDENRVKFGENRLPENQF